MTDWIALVANNDDDSLLDFTSQRRMDEPRLHLSLIRKRLRENRPEDAMAMIRSSLEKKNNPNIVYAGAGKLLYENGLYDEAFSILREGVHYDAKDSTTLNNLVFETRRPSYSTLSRSQKVVNQPFEKETSHSQSIVALLKQNDGPIEPQRLSVRAGTAKVARQFRPSC